MIPSKRECHALLKESSVPSRIAQHSRKVAEVALQLAQRIKARGIPVSLPLVEAGALLHDIDKLETLKSGGHGERGAELLRMKGYPEVARIALTHVLHSVLEPGRRPASWEEKTVYYADKRVRHTEVVTLAERLDDLCARYGSRSEAAEKSIEMSTPLAYAIEEEIRKAAGMSKAELSRIGRIGEKDGEED